MPQFNPRQNPRQGPGATGGGTPGIGIQPGGPVGGGTQAPTTAIPMSPRLPGAGPTPTASPVGGVGTPAPGAGTPYRPPSVPYMPPPGGQAGYNSGGTGSI